jgi:hypothetical protein
MKTRVSVLCYADLGEDGDAMCETRRFIDAVSHGELWEHRDGRWPMQTAYAQAIVRPAASSTVWMWGVRLLPSEQTFSGHEVTDHDAMRAAERVVEEHRPLP